MGISFEKRIQGIRLFEQAMLEQKTPKGNSIGVTHPSDGQEAVRQVFVDPPDGNLSFLLRFATWVLAWLILAASTAGSFLWGGLVSNLLFSSLGRTRDVGHELYISDTFIVVLPFQQASTANALVLALYATYLLVLVLPLFEVIKVGKIRTRAVPKVQVTAYGISWIAVVAVVLAGLVWAMAKPQNLGINSFLLASGMILSPYPVIMLLVKGKKVILKALPWLVFWNWFATTLLLGAAFFLELTRTSGPFGAIPPPIISEFINTDSVMWNTLSVVYTILFLFPIYGFLTLSAFLYPPYLVLFILATPYMHFHLIFSINGSLKDINPRIAFTPILGVLFQYLYLRNGLRVVHWNLKTNIILLSWSAVRLTFEVSVITFLIGLAAYTDYSSLSNSGNGFFPTFVSGFEPGNDFFSIFGGDFYPDNALIFALLSVPVSLILPYTLLTNRLKQILNGSGTAVAAGAAKPTAGETV